MLDGAELHRYAEGGAILLTPNLRAAKQLRSRLATHASRPNAAAALGDQVLHWRAWTSALWRETVLEGRDERVLLHPLQERLLWEQILDSDEGVERSDALLDLCLSAVTLLYRHDAADALLAERESGTASDVASFTRWFRAFDDRCRRELLLPSAALEAALTSHAKAGHTAQTIVLCDLAGVAPTQRALLTALSQHGTAVVEAPHQRRTASNPVLLGCKDDADELQTLVHHLTHAVQSAQRPDIAVVVPDLSSARDRIDRILREHLPAPAETSFVENRYPLWEFSTGRPLAAYPVIADALHLLTWTVRELGPAELSLLLRSQHLQWPIDPDAVASLDAGIMRRHPHLRGTWTPRSAANLLQKSSPALSETLLQRTRSWDKLHGSTGSFTKLAERARQVLRDFGWFGSEHRTSTDFQAVTRFHNLFDTLSSLDLIGGEVPSWSGFVQRLTAATRSTSFQRENTNAPIQFLTPDESTGIEAAELWVLHADEERWSSRATPHPLLPRYLQQRYGMPGTDPALDQAHFGEQVERIAQIASTTTFSYACASETGERRLSPAVAALPSLEHRKADPSGALATLHATADLQTFEDGALIPLALTGIPIPGGVSTLQSQAACAFRAFAERRLGSTNLDVRDLGIDARARGTILHRALQVFWNEHSDRTMLRRLLADKRLDNAIKHAIHHALAPNRDRDDHWANAYLEIQRTNLHRLLRRWLLREADRPDFRVLSTEAERLVTLGPISMSVRIDRIDEVTTADGNRARVILDYKTGTPSPKKWEGDRPDEPQLPLYATSLIGDAEVSGQADEPLGAIAFGVVRAGDKLNFVTAPKNTAWLFEDPKASTATLTAEAEAWRQTLQSLSEDFASGAATVDPKDYPATCRFCDQRLLCRLNPALADVEDFPEIGA